MSSKKSHNAIILDRLKEQLSIEKDKKLSQFLGFAPNTVSSWRSRGSRLPLETMIAKCVSEGKSVDWNYVLEGSSSSTEGMRPYSVETQPSTTMVPVFLVPAPAGDMSPGSDHVSHMINVVELGLRDGTGIFAVEVVGNSMKGVGIDSGDLVVVDKSIEPKSGAIVVASVDNELTIKRFQQLGQRTFLYPASDDYKPIELIDGMSITVWGVATRVVKSLPIPN